MEQEGRNMSELIDRGDVLGVISCFFKDNDIDGLADLEREINRLSTASPWHRVEEPPLPNQDLWLHDEHGYYHVGYISIYRGYTEYIDMDGNALHGIDYWTPIQEPPKEEE